MENAIGAIEVIEVASPVNSIKKTIRCCNLTIADSQKHLGLILESKLDFNEHIESKIAKCNEIIRSMKKLSLILSRKSLLTIYKSFVIFVGLILIRRYNLRQTVK